MKLEKGAFVSDLEPVSVCGTEEDPPSELSGGELLLQDMVDRVDGSVGDSDRRRLLGGRMRLSMPLTLEVLARCDSRFGAIRQLTKRLSINM